MIPFSAMSAAGISSPEYIQIIATTPDTTRLFERTCRRDDCNHAIRTGYKVHDNGSHSYKQSVHFLGETLFKWRGKYYVSGLDRNDDPSKRNFFLAQLPNAVIDPKTVAQGLDLLRPKGVAKDTPRQGEWFLVPAPKVKPKAKDPMIFKQSQVHSTFVPSRGRTRGGAGGKYITAGVKPGVPIISDIPAEQQTAILFAYPVARRFNRHRATHMFINGSVYVRGRLRDNEHGTYVIGDGKTWHKVVKNLSQGSWQANGGAVD